MMLLVKLCGIIGSEEKTLRVNKAFALIGLDSSSGTRRCLHLRYVLPFIWTEFLR